MLDRCQVRRFSGELKRYMERYELPASQMQRRSGVDAVMIGAYTHGAVIPPLSDAVALLHATGIAPSQIDVLLDLEQGTAHDVMTERWYDAKCRAASGRRF